MGIIKRKRKRARDYVIARNVKKLKRSVLEELDQEYEEHPRAFPPIKMEPRVFNSDGKTSPWVTGPVNWQAVIREDYRDDEIYYHNGYRALPQENVSVVDRRSTKEERSDESSEERSDEPVKTIDVEASSTSGGLEGKGKEEDDGTEADDGYRALIDSSRQYSKKDFPQSTWLSWLGKTVQGVSFTPLALANVIINSPKMVRTYWSTGAVTYPETRYIGPGNTLDEGEPLNEWDNLAYVHDVQYSELIAKGVNPYLTFNNADRLMLHELKQNMDLRAGHYGAAVWAGINAKKIFPNDDTPVSYVLPWSETHGAKRSRIVSKQYTNDGVVSEKGYLHKHKRRKRWITRPGVLRKRRRL